MTWLQIKEEPKHPFQSMTFPFIQLLKLQASHLPPRSNRTQEPGYWCYLITEVANNGKSLSAKCHTTTEYKELKMYLHWMHSWGLVSICNINPFKTLTLGLQTAKKMYPVAQTHHIQTLPSQLDHHVKDTLFLQETTFFLCNGSHECTGSFCSAFDKTKAAWSNIFFQIQEGKQQWISINHDFAFFFESSQIGGKSITWSAILFSSR